MSQNSRLVTPLTLCLAIVFMVVVLVFMNVFQLQRIKKRAKIRSKEQEPVMQTTSNIEMMAIHVRSSARRNSGAFPKDLSGAFTDDVDGWGRSMRIEPEGSPVSTYKIASAGPDGQFNTADDVAIRFDMKHEQVERINTFGMEESFAEMRSLGIELGMEESELRSLRIQPVDKKIRELEPRGRISEKARDWSGEPRAMADPAIGNWRHQRYGPERTSFNPHEVVIGASNVSRLQVKWKNRHRSSINWGVCVVGDMAFYGDYRGEFRAVKANTGATIWTKQLGAKYVGHAIVDGVAYVAAVNRLVAFDAGTGRMLWGRLPDGGQFTGDPVVVHGVCYVGTKSPKMLEAFDTNAGEQLWKVPGGSFAIDDGVIYKSHEQTIEARDAKTGSSLWETTVADGNLTGPVVSDGIIYLNSTAGRIYAFELSDHQRHNRSPMWVGEIPVQADGDGPQTPAFAYGKLFVGTNDRFYAFDGNHGGDSTRTPVWETQVETPFFSSRAPAIANGVVYSTAGYHDLFAFNASDGEMLWNFQTRGREYPMRSTPTIANGQLYHAATFDYTLYAFNLRATAGQ